MISGAVGPGDHDLDRSSIWLVSILGGAPRRLRGDAYRAQLSPDDSLVAYMSERGIWLADADGENPRELVAAGDWEFLGSPVWSSDGKRVVYRRVALKNGRVATIESRGLDEDGSTVLVRDESPPGRYFDPAWMMDFLMVDDRLVYARNEPAPRNREQNLWELAIDPRSGKPGGEPRRLTDWVGFDIAGLSITADGSQLAFAKFRDQSDVYVGELGEGGRSLDNARRLTLDDRDDAPSCWTPDSRAVVFASNRYGNDDLFVQGLDERNARDLVLGPGEQRGPRPTPDGAFFLYWEIQEGPSEWAQPRRLLRIPVAGGPTEPVLETPRPAWAFCAATAEGPCLLLEARLAEHVVTLSRLDPVKGKGEELLRTRLGPSVIPRFALSPDGSRLAVVGHTENDHSIRLLDALTGEAVRDIDLDGMPEMELTDVAWAPDGSGLYLIGESARGVALLHAGLQGEADVLYEDREGYFLSVEPSPDGRHLAFGKSTTESNVWLIEDF